MSQNKKFKFKGKQVLLLGLVALVITAGYYRWTVETEKLESVPVTGDTLPANADEKQQSESQDTGNQGENQGSADTNNKEMTKLKQERDKARSEAVEQWKEISKSSEATQETKQTAENKVKTANEYSEKEKSVETLVKAKGYDDCFAHIDESGVSVIVSGGEVNGAKVAQIKDIIVDTTGVDVKNIKISAQ